MSAVGRFFKVVDDLVFLHDDAPQWLSDAVFEAHDGASPNNWVYEQCMHAVGVLDDGCVDDDEVAADLVDVYTADLIAWLADDQMCRVGYVDQAMEEFAPGTLSEALAVGQRLQLEHIVRSLVTAMEGAGDDDDE
jgi:hypothetical protein